MGRCWVVALLGAASVSMSAMAEDVGSGRRVQNVANVATSEVGDVPGHVVGMVEFKGITFFENGEVATHVNPATFDLIDGTGPHQGYVVHHFDDGSTSVEHYRGAVRAEGERSVVEGTFECIGGTGRFEGLKGEGSYQGERVGALETGNYVYVDFKGSCTAP